MFQHLLVPLDGSELAEVALPLATAVAKKFHSQITLISAVHLPYYIGDGLDFVTLYDTMSQSEESESKAYLQRKQEVLMAQGLDVDFHVVVGEPPADAILHVIDEWGIDTIVMSTHGRGGLMRWVFGSVADKVLRNATVPVLLARVVPQQMEMAGDVTSDEAVA
ncbi:MAG: universal stress protein [Anaerolineales bacterium]|nr:universal stress protein [Anaerolineales bacterium]